VDDAKTAIMERLKIGDREQHSYIHIADMGTYSQTFAMQMLSEYRDIKFQSGRPMTFWARKPGVRAEVLDCCVYAWAVRQTIKPNWETRRKNLTRVPEQEDEQEDSGWATF
jgi:phage terminase large subunit GpA-like protein